MVFLMRTIIILMAAVVAAACASPLPIPDSTTIKAAGLAASYTAPQRDSIRRTIKITLRDPSHEFYLMDLNYVKYGPITAFRHDKFYVWDTPVTVPADSVAVLYEYRTQSATGALLGVGVPLVAATVASLLHASDNVVNILASSSIITLIAGWFGGSLIEERTEWPCAAFRK